MNNANFIVYNNEIIINNIQTIKEFSEKSFLIEINNEAYEIKGTDLILKEVGNDNKTIKINGVVSSIEKKNKLSKEKSQGFFKRLFA
ncbi:MAG TPA: hypothetical protein IAD46_05965 [Candidatus Pelethenecus faecipullorum]|uniref:Sporulation protein YabP n=1 Tax=Candidatus Pelethenecus faecipullorum TaxID=2840900 RepID=A0A9D1GSE5_9MOLU|nr:hypothetical protein [Candidatus Pelethenecus faecipullorum]